MRSWSELEFQAWNRFIYRELQKCPRVLDEEECLSEAWRAFLEARHGYRRVAGCCDFATYAAFCIQERMDLLRRRRNVRISLESGLSLDLCFDGSNESVGSRYYTGRVGDCVAYVLLQDWIERQEALGRHIVRRMLRGMEDQEIMEEMGINAHQYYQELARLQETFRAWQAI